MPNISNFCNSPYIYYKVILKKDQLHEIKNINDFTIFLINKNNAHVYINNLDKELFAGDSLIIKNKKITIKSLSEETIILISGVNNLFKNSFSKITRSKDHYKVNKPWGHELWITKNNENYVFKEISLKKGFRTSLQYHNFKEETNFIFSGKLNYFVSKNLNKDNVKCIPMNSDEFVHVEPKVIHRFQALEDSYLYETSTFHLDDVIRLSDDTNRTDGRIESEHKK